jgi:hypothetical protein
MDNACKRATRGWVADSSLWALGLLLLQGPAHAAEARRAVQAQHGEIVVLRNVATRPADRQAPPGMALIVSPSPRHELSQALGTNELSDEEYASLDAAPAAGSQAHGTTVERMVGNSLGGSLGSNPGPHGGVSGNGFSNVIGAPIGVVGSTAGGIGNQVQGALSQLPGLAPAPAGGH